MANNDKPDARDELLSEIFEHASPRPKPPTEVREQAFEVLRGEWLELTAKRRSQRRIARWSLAATVAIAAVLGFRALDTVDAPPAGLVAQIVRTSGDAVRANNRPVSANGLSASTVSLSVGDSLQTGVTSLVALAWSEGGSLRLAGSSQIEFASGESVRLIEGALYFDSRRFDQAENPDLKFIVETPYGRVTHIGTQFLVDVQPGKLNISVREGMVHLDGRNTSVDIRSGSAMQFESTGGWSKGSIAAHDERWNWAAEIAPALELDGRTHEEFFQWVGRETGREVIYRGPGSLQNTRNLEVKGMGSLGPLPALNAARTMGLQFEEESARIIVE